MKYWLSHLPLEVWVDVYRYPWISREELGRIVDRFRNRKYAEYLQFFLHDWGKRKLNTLYFEKDGLYKHVNYAPYRLYMDIPLTPLPNNIKCFESIHISYFDRQILNFLRQIGPILTIVDLELCRDSPDLVRTILPILLPLLDGVHSLKFNVRELPTMKQYFGENMAQIPKLIIFHYEDEPMVEAMVQTTVNFLTDWLTSPQDGNGPKWCEARIYNGIAFGPQIVLAIREQFFAAKDPCTFALNLWLYPKQEFAEFHLNNGIGEELHGVLIGLDFHITRHRTNCGKGLQEWINKNQARSHQGRIEICTPEFRFVGVDVI